jgi:hypothetical protein
MSYLATYPEPGLEIHLDRANRLALYGGLSTAERDRLLGCDHVRYLHRLVASAVARYQAHEALRDAAWEYRRQVGVEQSRYVEGLSRPEQEMGARPYVNDLHIVFPSHRLGVLGAPVDAHFISRGSPTPTLREQAVFEDARDVGLAASHLQVTSARRSRDELIAQLNQTVRHQLAGLGRGAGRSAASLPAQR